MLVSVKDLQIHPNRFEKIISNKFVSFTIYELSNILDQKLKNVIILDFDSIFGKIKSIKIETEIAIDIIPTLENDFIYLFIFDHHILIIDEISNNQFTDFINEISNKSSFLFINSACQQKIDETRRNGLKRFNKKLLKLKEMDKTQKIDNSFSEKVKLHILNCIIKKSQQRTKNRNYQSYLIQTKISTDRNDYVPIMHIANQINLEFNIKDQYLYISKTFITKDSNSKSEYEHEISIYKEINNFCNPFICKFYCELTQNTSNKTIIIDYIEGETLNDFINNNKKLSKEVKIKIILQIMCAIECLHLNNIICRDIKYDNIMIDSNFNSFLIDFNHSKKYDGSENTYDINRDYFSETEQNTYSYYTI